MDRQDLVWMTGLPLLGCVMACGVMFGLNGGYYSECSVMITFMAILSILSAYVNKCIFEEMDDRVRSLRSQRDFFEDKLFSSRKWEE